MLLKIDDFNLFTVGIVAAIISVLKQFFLRVIAFALSKTVT